MFSAFIAYAITLVLFVCIDLVWLMGPGRPFYVAEIGNLLRGQPQLGAAIAFYLLYAIGLTYFAVVPGMKAVSSGMALGQGVLFGLVAYATYDLTNLAVMNGFTLRIAVIDMVWGAVLSGVAAWAASKMTQVFGLS